MATSTVRLECGHVVRVWDGEGKRPDVYGRRALEEVGKLRVECYKCAPVGERASGLPAYAERRAPVPEVLRGWWLTDGGIGRDEGGFGEECCWLYAHGPEGGMVRIGCRWYDFGSRHDGPLWRSWDLEGGMRWDGSPGAAEAAWREAVAKLGPWGAWGSTLGGDMLCLLWAAGARFGAEVRGWQDLCRARVECLKAERAAAGQEPPSRDEMEVEAAKVARFVPAPVPGWLLDLSRHAAETWRDEQRAEAARDEVRAGLVAAGGGV